MQTLAHKIVKSNVALVCMILLLGSLTHAAMLAAPFKTLDDDASIVNNPDIRSFRNIGKVFTTSFFGGRHYYRPMVELSFMLEYHAYGLRPFYYNLTNLALHLATAVTVFFLVLSLLEDRAASFFTSLLFAVHPVHWEAVANIPGRAVLLATFFAVTAFFFYILSEEKRRFLPCYGLSLALFACGLLSKESAAMLPALLVSYMFFSERGGKRYALTVPYFALIAAYLFLRRTIGVMETYPWRSPAEHALGFFTFLRAVLTYLRLLVWPAGLHFDRATPMYLKFSDLGLLATLIAVVALGAVLFKARKHVPGYALFFVSWFVIELFPVSQVVTTIGVGPGYISSAEHFLYAPSVGAFALIVLGVRRLMAANRERGVLSPGVARIFVGAAFLALMTVTLTQEIYARSALAMFRRTLEYNPNNARILFSTGIELVNRGRYAEAEAYFRRAVAQEPLHASYRLSLGRALFDQGKVAAALQVYDGIVNAGQWSDLLVRNREEANAVATARYQALVLREPNNAQAHYSLGTVYARAGRITESVEQFKRAVALAPEYKEAVFNLASSYGILGDELRAAQTYQRALAIDGAQYLDLAAYRHLGEIYRRRGDEVRAREYFRKSEALLRGK